jgi:hypothetical protein
VLAKTLGKLHERNIKHYFYQPVNVFVINPKSITMGELYGETNPLTTEWKDGLMAITIRRCEKVKKIKQNFNNKNVVTRSYKVQYKYLN